MNMMNYKKTSVRQGVDVGLHQYMISVYRYMTLGLSLTGGIVIALMFAPLAIQKTVYGLSWIALFGTLGIAIYFGYAGQRMQVSRAQMLFWIFSALMGVALTSIVSIYYAESIAKAFLITAGTFGAASIYGNVTKKDLTSVGSFCMMGLYGIIIASIVNIFFQSPGWDFALSIISVIVFTGLTAYDTQNIKQTYFNLPCDSNVKERFAILGALSLYLDVINLFLSFLRLIGDRK